MAPSLLQVFTLTYILTIFSQSNAITSDLWNSGVFTVPSTFSIDASQAYIYGASPNVLMPQGCSCKESDVAKSECSVFTCDCMCDLNAGQCDLNCCCDKECSPEDVATFSQCDDAGYKTDIIETCASREVLNSVNPKYPMKSGDAALAAAQTLLCVHEYNTEIKGRFFSNPSSAWVASNVFSANGAGRKPYSYTSYEVVSPLDSAMAVSEPFYMKGDSIRVVGAEGASGSKYVYGGSLPLPRRGEMGLCNDQNAVGFGEDVGNDEKDSQCLRKVPAAMADGCGEGKEFDFKRFTHDIYVAKSASAVSGSTSLPSADPSFLNITTPYLAGSFTTQSASQVSPTVDAGGNCLNALLGLTYQIRYDSSGKIVDVDASVTLGTIAAGTEYVVQTFGVEFLHAHGGYHLSESGSTYGPSGNAVSGNFVNRTRSGNPGYIDDRPVLAGKVHPDSTSTPKAVSALVSGLTTFSTSDGSCSGGGFDASGTVVGFGTDLSVGCTKSFTRASLKAFCATSNAADLATLTTGKADQSMHVPQWLVDSVGDGQSLVGIYGNADPLDATQWMEVFNPKDSEDFEAKSVAWKESESSCEGIPTSVNYEFMWSYSGSTDSPQAKISSVQVSYEDKAKISFVKGVGEGETQDVQFMSTVTWVYYERDSEVYSPPPPPIIFSVPYDVFYPFEIYSGAERIGWALLPVAVGIVGMLMNMN